MKRYVGFQLWLKAVIQELGSPDLLAEWEQLFMERKTFEDPVYAFCLKVDRAFRAKEILDAKDETQNEGEEDPHPRLPKPPVYFWTFVPKSRSSRLHGACACIPGNTTTAPRMKPPRWSVCLPLNR